MILLGRLEIEIGCGGRKLLSKGIKAGRTTAVEARDEKRVKTTDKVRLMMLSRGLSMISITDSQVRGAAIGLLKTPHIACTVVSSLQAPDLRYASSDLRRGS